MMRLAFAIVPLLLLLGACASTPRGARSEPAPEVALGQPVAVGELRRPVTYAMLGVIVPAELAPEDALAAMTREAIAKGLTLATNMEETLGGAVLLELVSPPTAMYNPSLLEPMSRGLDERGLEAVRGARHAISVVLAGPSDALAVVHRAASDLARRGVERGGWVLDAGSIEMFSADRFTALRPAGFPVEVGRLVVVMVAEVEDGLLVETRGMERLGLPEVRMRAVPEPHVDGAVALVNAAAQMLLEQGAIEREGELVVDLTLARSPLLRSLAEVAKGRGGARAVALGAYWEAGDPSGRGAVSPGEGGASARIRLVVRRGGASTDEEALVIALGQVFGDSDARVTETSDEDPELDAASSRMKAELEALVAYFAGGIPKGERLVIKAPFAVGDGSDEYMWIEVSVFGDVLTGVLLDQPSVVPGLALGDRVTVKRADVYDYVHIRADGSQAGGATNAILKRRLAKPEAAP